MALSNYLEDKLLDHAFRNTSYSPPATVYAALMTAAPGETGGGTEVSGGGGSYSRQAITFGASSAGAMANTAAVTFTGLPVATITHFAIYDAATNGNLLAYGALASQIVTVLNSEIEFAIGDIDLTMD